MKTTLLILLVIGEAFSWRIELGDDNSCVGRCGNSFDGSKPCQCNTACESHNDCCDDYMTVCSAPEDSCAGRCGAGFDGSFNCQCNDPCVSHNDCCPDFSTCNGGDVSAEDVIAFSEEIFRLESNNVGAKVQVDIGGTTSVGNTQDKSPAPLFTSVDESVMNLPIYQKLFALYDNYEKKTTVVEDHTEQEHQEELDFLQDVLDSEVMKTTYAFLTEKGLFSGTYENFGEKLYTLWFGQYERATGVLSSSGFEHVFIGEVKNGEVSGYHNWFSLYNQEKGGHINYLGYWKHANIGNNEGHGLEFTFSWDNVQKPYGSTMIGTSPELELALYTTCLLTYPNEQCHVRLGGTDVFIQTWTQYYNGELMVGSSYPDFA